ncbi:MAG: cytidine deaminase [Alphaproteobacteria bacterium]|nr:MAG: cytidine deaminase [Alphaproteobacteria bacterium]
MTSVSDQELMRAAETVRARAHAPYSRYHVGAALLDEAGRLHLGCNVENAAYPEGTCAETNAIGAMVAAGGSLIRTIAVAGGPAGDEPQACTPCGGCRQRIREFADAETRILLADGKGGIREYRMGDLLPLSFSLAD